MQAQTRRATPSAWVTRAPRQTRRRSRDSGESGRPLRPAPLLPRAPRSCGRASGRQGQRHISAVPRRSSHGDGSPRKSKGATEWPPQGLGLWVALRGKGPPATATNQDALLEAPRNPREARHAPRKWITEGRRRQMPPPESPDIGAPHRKVLATRRSIEPLVSIHPHRQRGFAAIGPPPTWRTGISGTRKPM